MDEQNFETLITSELYEVKMDATKSLWKEKDMWSSLSVSPDKTYILVTKIQRPFSYLVQYDRFALETN